MPTPFDRQHVAGAPSSALYVTGEDHLRVTSFNAGGATVLAVEGRFVDLAGEVRPLAERHVPLTSRGAFSTLHTLAEGYLSHVMVRDTSDSIVIGQCFVVVELVRGRLGAVQPIACLLQGYVSSTMRLAWPGSSLTESAAGPGFIRNHVGANPAAGVEIVEAVPVNARWRILSFFATLVTDATVANRTVTFIVDDGANTLWRIAASAAQTASQTRNYEASASGGAGDLSDITFRMPVPFPLLLGAGFRVRTSTAGIVAGDDWASPVILVEEWIQG